MIKHDMAHVVRFRSALMITTIVMFLSGCSLLETQQAVKLPLPVASPEDAKQLASPLFCGGEGKQAAQLLKQGAYYHQLTGERRQTVCRQLSQLYQDQNYWQAGWLLAYSFSDKPSCITHKQRQAILSQLQQSGQLSEYLTWLNDNYRQTLGYIDRFKQSKAQHKQERDALQQENARLKAQIQALKAIEKTINQRIDDDNAISR